MSPTNALTAFGQDHRTYLFCFDVTTPGLNVDILAAYIRDAWFISDWSHLFPGAYILRSTKNTLELSESFRAIIIQGRCVFVEVNPFSMGGWLPPAAWEWMASKATVPAPALFPPLPHEKEKGPEKVPNFFFPRDK
jgi:hypothetical protein